MDSNPSIQGIESDGDVIRRFEKDSGSTIGEQLGEWEITEIEGNLVPNTPNGKKPRVTAFVHFVPSEGLNIAVTDLEQLTVDEWELRGFCINDSEEHLRVIYDFEDGFTDT